MKRILPFFLAGTTIFSAMAADTLLFSNGHTASGKVLQTNGDAVLLLTRHAVYNFSRTYVKEIHIDPEENARSSNTDRLSDFERAILKLSKQPWATNIAPIPATVIDKGILSNVPYSSIQCGDNYEINIYGDLDHPAGVEIGFYKVLADDQSRQSNCIEFMSELLAQATDKALLQALNHQQDLKTLDDLTFEITPPSASDSYGGWWISVYSEKQLNLARASDAEMKHICVSRADTAKESSAGDSSQWSADELKRARAPVPSTITFTDKSGEVISNAAVRIYEPGVSLMWEIGSRAGLIKLADLPEDLRNRFGYDPVKANASDALQKEKKEKLREEYAAAVLAAQQAQNAAADQSSSGLDDQSVGDYSSGARVYVHGYYRSNGTYVNAYTRSYPRR